MPYVGDLAVWRDHLAVSKGKLAAIPETAVCFMPPIFIVFTSEVLSTR